MYKPCLSVDKRKTLFGSNTLKHVFNSCEGDEETKRLKSKAIPSIFPWTATLNISPASTLYVDIPLTLKTYSRTELSISFVEEVPFMALESNAEEDPLQIDNEECENEEHYVDNASPIAHIDNVEINIMDDLHAELCEVVVPSYDDNDKSKFDNKKEVAIQTCDDAYELPLFTSEIYKNSDTAIHFYTGLENYEKVKLVLYSLGECVSKLKYFYGPPPKKILSSIQFLANGGYQRQVGQDHTLCQSQTTMSSFLEQFLQSIYRRLLAEWVHFPGTEPARRSLASGFEEKFNVPGILGLIDCTHVKIFPPPGPHGAQYKNRRKAAHTLNVQLIADSECKILSVNARYPGRVHDAFIWNHCAVRQEMKRLYERGIGNYYLLGDSGYPLEPWLMTPVLDTVQNTPEQRYTDWHCRVRNAVERTNGYLKGSLRCLGIDRVLHYAPEKASQIIYASCIIYNLMKHFGVPLEEEQENRDDNVDDSNEPNNETPVRLLRLSQARRAELIRNYFN